MCRRVQDERPRASTSGGQSGGAEEREWEGEEEEEKEEGVDLVMAAQEAKEVQERHLGERREGLVRRLDGKREGGKVG